MAKNSKSTSAKNNFEAAPQSHENSDPAAELASQTSGSAAANLDAIPADESNESMATPSVGDEVDDELTKADNFAALSTAQLIERLQKAEQEVAHKQEGLLRAAAEVENMRRRTQKEIVATRKFAIEGFARELLSVKDSLEQASIVELDKEAGKSVRQMKEGLELTLKQFDMALAKFSIVEVAAEPGARFDPLCHQAVSTTPSEKFAVDQIVSVMQKGFLLKERLLRPAMVVVATKA